MFDAKSVDEAVHYFLTRLDDESLNETQLYSFARSGFLYVGADAVAYDGKGVLFCGDSDLYFALDGSYGKDSAMTALAHKAVWIDVRKKHPRIMNQITAVRCVNERTSGGLYTPLDTIVYLSMGKEAHSAIVPDVPSRMIAQDLLEETPADSKDRLVRTRYKYLESHLANVLKINFVCGKEDLPRTAYAQIKEYLDTQKDSKRPKLRNTEIGV